MATALLPGLIAARVVVNSVVDEGKWNDVELRVLQMVAEKLKETIAYDAECVPDKPTMAQ